MTCLRSDLTDECPTALCRADVADLQLSNTDRTALRALLYVLCVLTLPWKQKTAVNEAQFEVQEHALDIFG